MKITPYQFVLIGKFKKIMGHINCFVKYRGVRMKIIISGIILMATVVVSFQSLAENSTVQVGYNHKDQEIKCIIRKTNWAGDPSLSFDKDILGSMILKLDEYQEMALLNGDSVSIVRLDYHDAIQISVKRKPTDEEASILKRKSGGPVEPLISIAFVSGAAPVLSLMTKDYDVSCALKY
jgi:hypothetical protein